MNRLIVNYRVDPEVAAALLPAQLRPRIVNGHAVAGLVVGHSASEHRVAVESGAYLLHSESAPLIAEERADRVYASMKGVETVDVSVRPARAWHSRLFGDARAAARFAGVVAAVPVAVDWVRSSYFDALEATVDCALLLADVPVAAELAA